MAAARRSLERAALEAFEDLETTMKNPLFVKPVSLIALLVTSTAGRAEMSCDDFLAKLGKRPRTIEFLGCKSNTTLQGRPLEASYKVSGASAAEAEDHLVKAFGIKRLRRVCCVWESSANFYRDKNRTGYVIDMATAETTLDRRSRWHEIPYFYIRVRAYDEDP